MTTTQLKAFAHLLLSNGLGKKQEPLLRSLTAEKPPRMTESTWRARRVQSERKAVEERLAVGAAALQHLEMSLVNTACDDPGAAIGSQLALPLLQVPAPWPVSRHGSLDMGLTHLFFFFSSCPTREQYSRYHLVLISSVRQLMVSGFALFNFYRRNGQFYKVLVLLKSSAADSICGETAVLLWICIVGG